MRRVLIIEGQMMRYRMPFYAKLFEQLRSDGIQLNVAYSDPPSAQVQKLDTCELPSEYGLRVNGYWLFGSSLLYQPMLTESLRADLVIVDQANKFLLNHALLPISRLGLRKIAFWGLGQNRQAGQIHISEWYRRVTLNWVSWWFAYTRGTAKYLQDHGVPASKITVVQNSVDTREMREDVRALGPLECEEVRSRLGISAEAPVGIFCGMLDKVKSVPFLIESSQIIQTRIPNFHLIVIGGGPEQDAVRHLAQGMDWVHFLGPQFGRRKAELMAISDVFMLPGRVGLAILDAFAAGIPLLSTRLSIHGPEMEYLEEDMNGLITEADTSAYANAVASVLVNKDRLRQLQKGATDSADKYSIERMVRNFRRGILRCLNAPSFGAGDLAQESSRNLESPADR